MAKKPIKRFSTRTLRGQLDTINRWLKNGDTAKDLWHVLTALRGPDNGNEVLKNHTTARIRGKAFPQVMRADGIAIIHRNYNTITVPDAWHNAKFNHFNSHARKAAKALGMKIELPNE